MRTRLKILVSAYACNPYRGSEEGVGWGWVKAIARNHKVHVLTATYHRADIEKALPGHPELAENAVFHYVPHKPWDYRPTKGWRFIEGSILKPIMNNAYRLWQRDAYRLGAELHERERFDLVHLVTYVGFRFPGHLWKLDVPFVWGPIGGLENTPWRLLPMLGLGGAVYYGGRNVINSLHKRFLGLPKRAFAKASSRGAVIAATEGIRREIRRWYGCESEVICEIGTPGEVAADLSIRQPGEPLRLAWSGLHLPGKALPLLLKAAAMLPADVDWRLDILGEGPCTQAWRRQAERLGLNGRCTWHGWLPREQAVALIHGSHVFVITSLKDLTSTVLLEALSQCVPVVCPDHCGFADVVTDECGIKVPVVDAAGIARGIAHAVERLARDEVGRRAMAGNALRRAADFTWERKAERLKEIYQQALSSTCAAFVKPGGEKPAKEVARSVNV